MRAECRFDLTKSKHILLFPGLLAPVRYLYPLVEYLRVNRNQYGVTAIPLRMSIASFERIVHRATKNIDIHLIKKSEPQEIILFAHSFGGRVACEVLRNLQVLAPNITYTLITAGSPMGKKKEHSTLTDYSFFDISKAYREWPPVRQSSDGTVKKYLGYYSDADQTVVPHFAKANFQGELIELHGFSHRELVSPSVIGPKLLPLLG